VFHEEVRTGVGLSSPSRAGVASQYILDPQFRGRYFEPLYCIGNKIDILYHISNKRSQLKTDSKNILMYKLLLMLQAGC